MANHGCINGTLSGTNYSSPVPVIGLYIAATTLVSLLYDAVLVGFYTRKRWLACKLFKLDSITLTLVSIVVKLTVDLTTPMPSVLDQLSKLCGTSFLCAYMGYIMPSVGLMNDPTNMYSLSILVITVCVNMCIQISTGVVVLFIPEHIIVLCIMLILLGLLWDCAGIMKFVKRYTREKGKSLFTRSKESVIERLKICYLYGFGSDSQFLASKIFSSFCIGALNLFSLAVLIQAAFRSVIMKSDKFCRGNSDYSWSMPIITVTQILTITVGSFVSIIRSFTMFKNINYSYKIGGGEPYESNPIWNNSSSIKDCCDLLLGVIHITISIIFFPIFLISIIKEIYCDSNYDAAIEKFKRLIADENIGIDGWTLGKGLTEMEKEIKVHQSEPNEFFKLLSKITPSQQLQSMVVEQISDPVGLDGESIPVSILSLVLLVRIAQVCLPKHLTSSLVKTFQEVYECLCFIEENLFLTSPEFAKKLEVARAVWLADDFNRLVVKTFDQCATSEGQSPFDANGALAIIEKVKNKMPPKDMIYCELTIIESNIKLRQYSSIKELFDCIEQLYVDMLHVIFAQFPIATFNALSTESTSEVYQDRVRLALKIFYKIEQLETRIQWKFPQGYNLMGLITAPILATEEEGNAAVNNFDVLHATEDTIEVETEDTASVALLDDNDVIIEVEDPISPTVFL